MVPVSFGDVEGITRLENHFVSFEAINVWIGLAQLRESAKINGGMHRARNLVKVFILPLVKEPNPFLAIKMAEQQIDPVKILVNSSFATWGTKEVGG